MRSEKLINELKRVLNASELKQTISALMQDNLIWNYLQKLEGNQGVLEAGGNTSSGWKPANIVLALLTNGKHPDASQLSMGKENLFDEKMILRAQRTLEDFIRLPGLPDSLEEAGLLSIALREEYLRSGTWKAVIQKIIHSQDGLDDEWFLNWQTPLTCLWGMAPNANDLLKTLILEQDFDGSMHLISHILLSNPLSIKEQVTAFSDLMSDLKLSQVIRWLRYLNGIGRETLSAAVSGLIESISLHDTKRYEKDLQNSYSDDLDSTLKKAAEKYYQSNLYALAGKMDEAIDTFEGVEKYLSDALDYFALQKVSLGQIDQNHGDEKDSFNIFSPHTTGGRDEMFLTLPPEKMNDVNTNENHLQGMGAYVAIRKAFQLYQNGEINRARNIASEAVREILKDENNKAIKNSHHPVMMLKWNPAEYLENLTEMDMIDAAGNLSEYLLSQRPADGRIHHIKSEISRKAGDLNDAIQHGELAVSVDSENRDCYKNLAEIYSAAGNWQKVFETRKTVLSLSDQPDTEDWLAFGQAALKINQTTLATEAGQIVVDQQPENGLGHRLMADSLLQNQKIEEAIPYLNQATKLMPENEDNWLELARAYLENRQSSQAMEVLRTAVQHIPESPAINYSFADACLQSGHLSEGLHHARKASEKNPASISYSLLFGKLLKALGNLDEAEEVIGKSLEKSFDDVDLNYEYGKILCDLGKSSEALPYLEKALNSQKPQTERLVEYADALFHLSGNERDNVTDNSDIERVKGIVQEVLKLEPENIRAILLQAEIEKGNGNDDEAFVLFQKVAERSGKDNRFINQRVKSGLGQAALKTGRIDTALVALQESVENEPENAKLNRLLTDAYIQADLLENAYHSALKTRELIGDDVDALNWYFNIMLKLNEEDRAIETIKRLIALQPNCHDYKLKLAEIYVGYGKQNEARQLLDELCQTARPDMSDGMLKKAGDCYLQMGMEEDALNCYKLGIEVAVSDKGLLFNEILKFYKTRRSKDEYFAFLSTAREDYPQDVDIDILLAMNLAEAGRVNPALEIFEDTLKRNDESQLEERFLNWMNKKTSMETEGEDQEKADGSLPGLFEYLGVLAKSVGEFSKSYTFFEKALENDASNILLQFQIADITLRMSLDFRSNNFLSMLGTWIETALEKWAKESKSDSLFGACLVEFLCMRGEISSGLADDEQVIQDIEDAERVCEGINPHLLSLKARQLALKGERDKALILEQNAEVLAEYYFDELQQKYAPLSLGSCCIQDFRDLYQLSTADMALCADQLEKGIDLYNIYLKQHPDETRASINFVRSLVLGAEKQRLYSEVKCRNCSPGMSYLNPERLTLIKSTLSEINAQQLSDDVLRWQARAKMAFEPSQDSFDLFNQFILTPDDAAALIMGLRNSDDHDISQKIAAEFIADPFVKFQISLNCLKDRMLNGADIIHNALEQVPEHPLFHYVMARFSQLNHDVVNGYQEITTALEGWKGEPEWHFLAAEMAGALHKIDQKVEHLEKAYQIDEDNYDFVMALGSVYEEIGEYEKSLNILDTYRKKNADDAQLMMLMSKVYRKKNELESAFELSKATQKLLPESYLPGLTCAEIALEMGRPKLSLNYATKAYSQCSGCGDVARFLVTLYEKLGDVEKALKIVDEEINRGDAPVETYLLKIHLLESVNPTQDVLEEIEEIAEIFPKNDEISIQLAEAYVLTDRMEDAKKVIQKALRYGQDNPELNQMLGRIYWRHGQLDQAINYISKAIKIRPDNISQYLDLGDIHFERRENTKALHAYKEAMKRKPADFQPYYRSALVFKDSKDYISAEQMLRKALDLQPDELDIRRQLGAIIALNLVHHSQETTIL